jgi:bacillithiol system protein YtxJ
MIIELRDKQDLEELLKRSHDEPVLLFKHSTQCSRSAGVIEDFTAFERKHPNFRCVLNLVIDTSVRVRRNRRPFRDPSRIPAGQF